jgi:hypothetical protein
MVEPQNIRLSLDSRLDSHIEEAKNFLCRISDDKVVLSEWDTAWIALKTFARGITSLQRKWIHQKKAIGLNPPSTIRSDLNALINRLHVNKAEDEDCIDWGIRTTQIVIDTFALKLPYLEQAGYANYIEVVGNLIEDAIARTKHGEVLKLLTEYKMHPDIIAVGQFSSIEMASHYKYLDRRVERINREGIVQYLNIYRELCGIYEKDIVFAYCLCQLKERGIRPTYSEAHPTKRHYQERIEFVISRIKQLGNPYDSFLRNADAHVNIVTKTTDQNIIAYSLSDGVEKSYRYSDVVALTREMSALILAFRLIPAILSNRDWRELGQILK